MATQTITASINADSIASGAWRSNDTLVINNGAVVTVNTNQDRFWNGITINNGKLRIENNSTSQFIRFRMGRVSGVSEARITPASGLGSIEIAGNWIEIGTGNGLPGQVITLPCREHVAAVWVETAAGSGIYKPWTNVIHSMPIAGGEHYCEGLDGFGEGWVGNVFRQIPASSPMYHAVFTNCSTTNLSRVVTVGSTAGVEPGCAIVGSAAIPANSVVERVINGTQVEMNVAATANSSTVTVTFYNTQACWLTNQIEVGNGVHGNVIPNGAKVRIPNIMLFGTAHLNTMYSASYQFPLAINLTNGGSLVADKVLFSESRHTFTTPQELTLRDCAFSHFNNINNARGVLMERCAFSAMPQFPRLTSGRLIWGNNFSGGGTSSMHQYSYVTGTFRELVYCAAVANNTSAVTTVTGVLGFAYADGLVVDDVSIFVGRGVGTSGQANSKACLALQYVYRSSFTNIRASGQAAIALYASSENTFAEVIWRRLSRKKATSNGYISGSAYSQWSVGTLPDGTRLTNGQAYYGRFTHRGCALKSAQFAQDVEVCITPHVSGNLGFFNDIGFLPGNNQVEVRWDDRRPTHNGPAFEIYRSTTAGVPVRDAATRVFTTNTNTTVTWTDTGVTNGTRYYYVLRKYYAAGDFEDSPVWDVTPSAPPVVQNLMLRSIEFSNAQWVKSNVTVPASPDVPSPFNLPMSVALTTRRIQVTGANGTLTNTVTGLTIGQQYTASAWVYFAGSCNNAVNTITSTPGRLTFGTAFTDFTANQTWQRVTVTFTATATSHNFVLQFNTSGNWVDVGNCQVNTGATATADVITTSAALPSPNWRVSRVWSQCFPWADGASGMAKIEAPQITLGTTTLEFHVSDTRGFTPTQDTVVVDTDWRNPIFSLVVTSSKNVFRNFSQDGIGAPGDRMIELNTSSNDNLFEDLIFEQGMMGFNRASPFWPLLEVGADCNRTFLRNIEVHDSFPSSEGALVIASNNASGTRLQNVRATPYLNYVQTRNNDMVVRGMTGGNAYLGDASTTWTMGSLFDGVDTVLTGVYDTHFAELYHSDTTGALNILFSASSSDSPPYTTSGNVTFSNTGNLYFQEAGASITYTWPHRIYGVTGFRNIAHKVDQNDLSYNNNPGQGRDTLQALLVEYQIDTGAGYGAWTEATPANLSAEVVSATDGFLLRIRLTARQFFNYTAQTNNFVIGETIRHVAGGGTARVVADYDMGTTGCCVIDTVVGDWTTNTAVVRDSDSQARANIAYVNTSFALAPSFNSNIRGLQIHTTVDQTATYPLPRTELTVTGFENGSDIVIYDATIEADGSGSNVLASADAVSGSFVFDYDGTPQIRIGAFKAGYIPQISPVINLTTSNSSYLVQQRADRNYQ